MRRSSFATPANELLKIANQDSAQLVTFVDNVSVIGPATTPPVPEPEIVVSLGIGLAAVSLRKRRLGQKGI
jgi:hypothetical protein